MTNDKLKKLIWITSKIDLIDKEICELGDRRHDLQKQYGELIHGEATGVEGQYILGGKTFRVGRGGTVEITIKSLDDD